MAYKHTIKISALILLLVNANLKSQVKHIAGLGIGVTYGSPLPSEQQLRPEANLNYNLIYKFLLVKADVALLPVTKFGLQFRPFIHLGFTTKIEKVVSWHLCGGFGYLGATQKNYTEFDSELNPTIGTKYTYVDKGTPSLSTGFLINPFKSKKVYLGFDAMLFSERISYGRYDLLAYPISYNISVGLILHKQSL